MSSLAGNTTPAAPKSPFTVACFVFLACATRAGPLQLRSACHSVGIRRSAGASIELADSVGGTTAAVMCPKYTLAAGETAVCTYSADLGDTKPADGTNTATITSLTTGVDGVTATAPYAFGEPTTVKGYKVGDPVPGFDVEAEGF